MSKRDFINNLRRSRIPENYTLDKLKLDKINLKDRGKLTKKLVGLLKVHFPLYCLKGVVCRLVRARSLNDY